VPTKENFLTNLPDDKEALKAMLRSLWQERERLEKRADELYLEKLRLQLELERCKKATYGPRADRLSMNRLAQMLLEFAEALEQKPIQLEDLRPADEAEQCEDGGHAQPFEAMHRDTKRIAAKSAMGVTTFHRRFKQITGLSPIQFQKQLRLLQARKLLAFSGHSVSDAAFRVGYESASQFNREYSRFFGVPPARDASRRRQMNGTG
jgi:AraC-like DNA-binding protein